MKKIIIITAGALLIGLTPACTTVEEHPAPTQTTTTTETTSTRVSPATSSTTVHSTAY